MNFKLMFTNNRNSFVIVFVLLFFSTGFLFIDEKEKRDNELIDNLKKHVYYLASEELKGRFSGSDECYEAALYIKDHFTNAGLIPLFNDSYLQEFTFSAGVELGSNNSLKLSFDGTDYFLNLNSDFVTAPFSGSSTASSEIVFAGYGISASKLNYDDYADIDVTDKIVLVMRYHPEYESPHSQFDEYASFRYKATVARDKGAKGIIFVNGHSPKDEDDKLMEFKFDRGASVRDISVLHIKRNIVDELFSSHGKDFKDYQQQITEAKQPASFIFENALAEMNTEVNEVQKITWNVAGYLEGNDPELKNEYIVIGAHFDHLGMGEVGSLYRGDEPKIHYGADDNASGTAGMIELARLFAQNKSELKRSIIFMGFSGEELGLLGSGYFVNHSPVPVTQMAAMINLDMIGRLNDDKQLVVYGTGTSTKFPDVLTNKNNYEFKLSFVEDGYGPSDHSSFYGKEIPVLFFFTGTHTDYHRPADTADKINYEGLTEVTNYVYDVASEMVNKDERPVYVHVPRKDGGTMGGWRVYVGTIPDYATNIEGFGISGVNEGSPAQKAGIQAGDIMVRFGERKITNIYDYVYALREYVPGDVVDVVILRNGEEKTVKVELGAR